MTMVNMLDAKTNLSWLVEAVENGTDEVIIARNGRPAARLVPMAARGGAAGLIGIGQGAFDFDESVFDALDEEIADMFMPSQIEERPRP